MLQRPVVQRQRIGPAIRKLRHEQSLTLDDLAAQAGISASHLSRLERGQTLPPEAAKRLIGFAATRGLELTLDQIYGLQPLDSGAAPAPSRAQSPCHIELALVDRRERTAPIDFPDRRRPTGGDDRKAA